MYSDPTRLGSTIQTGTRRRIVQRLVDRSLKVSVRKKGEGMPVATPSAAPPDHPRAGQPVPLHCLVLVSTPIGNLGDVSTRARAVLAACDLILCEDTRRTGRLLAAMDIHTRTETLHEHNE